MPKRLFIAAALCAALGASLVFGVELPARTSADNGVTVSVTPVNVGPEAKVWDFRIVFDTHSQDLSDDLATAAVLIDGRGSEARAIAWEGAQPGGHHREGVLRFGAMQPQPAAIELRLRRAGEKEPRSFRWDLK